MDKTYHPQTIEHYWYPIWENQDYFAPTGQGQPYCIMIPPPNVTGTLHMGHSFQDTLMDLLIRYHRMSGHNTLWQAGTDHAGIATQMVVERQLLAQGLTRHQLGRDTFIQKVWEWKALSGGHITRQLRRMGASLDWASERFTLDEGLSRAVQTVFIQLYEEGLIYRGQRLVNWDPVLHTAVSDLEVVSQEEKGALWHLRYPLQNGTGYVEVATTRPETMLGDMAVAVHPEDERYQHLIGQHLILPLTDRHIPIIADTHIDPSFGTGCVKITPAHDFNDYAIAQRHQLPLLNLFTPDAKLNDNAPLAYRGLDRFVARKRIVADLEHAGLLAAIHPHTLMVPRGDRSHAIIEPLLTDQWYVKVAPLAAPAIQAVQAGHIRFIPENWAKTYFDWMENIQDWCISRQIWWGHRIPAWYDPQGQIYVASDEAAARQKYQLPDSLPLTQDSDVLDTWFSSALWPFSTLGWPEPTERLATFYPTSVLVTGFDIIFFWVARMIMMGLKFQGQVPFREVYIHGLIRDSEGQKMSKSKGNVLDPLDLIDGIDLTSLIAKRTTGLMQPDMAPRIEQITRQQFPEGIPAFGTDALRFTFAALASTGRDIRFELGRIEGYRNFCNKLWNASRYVIMNTSAQNDSTPPNSDPVPWDSLALPERWILTRLYQTIAQVHQHLSAYRFDLMAQTLYEFTWNEYCDWYLEFSKSALQSHSVPAQQATRYTLIQVLETLLRLLHPIIPFITEELWQKIAPLAGKTGPTLLQQPYPQPSPELPDLNLIQEIEWLKQVILGIRRIRAEMNIAPGKPLSILLQQGTETDRQRIASHQSRLINLARLESITWLDATAPTPESAYALVDELRILIPLAGLIDKTVELNRLQRETQKLRKDLEKGQAKLQNPQFTDKAPAEIIERERERVGKMEIALQELEAQILRIQALV